LPQGPEPVPQRTWVKLETVAAVFEACLAKSVSRTPVQAVQASP